MNAREMVELIDKHYWLHEAGFELEVIIGDIRNNYGRTKAEVRPTGGTGSKWVNFERLQEME